MTENQADFHELACSRYDRADEALDKITFVLCAASAMETTYSDNVVNGFVQIVDDAVSTLRKYLDDSREAMVRAELELA